MAKKLIIKEKFGQTPNSLLNNNKISLKAKGLYGYIQSKPNNWSFSVRNIASQLKEGISSINAGLKELEKFGYLNRVKYQDDKTGHWNIDYQLNYNPCVENQYKDTQKPCVENPNTENPNTENHINKVKKNKVKKNSSKKDDDERKKFDINILLKKYLDDEVVTKAIIQNQRIKGKDDLKIWLNKFNISLEEIGATQKTYPDYKSHFRNWYKKQDKTKEINKPSRPLNHERF